MEEDSLKKWMSQVRKGSLELCILGLIKEKDIYAFELIQELEKIESLVLTEGTIYPLLKRLQGDELISSFWVESDNGPPRKYYKMTEKGNDFFSEMEKEWTKFNQAINDILNRSKKNDYGTRDTSKDRLIHFKIEK
ncbi:MAG: PadR family transcriptional regulator [Candidatus Sericytochromatia bacterium]